MKKKLTAIALFLCLTLGLLAGCGGQETASAAAAADETEAAAAETAADTVAAVTEADTTIVFSSGRPDVDGPGAEIDDDFEVDIQSGGVYRVTGASDTGRIVVEAGETEDVTIILAGCDLAYADDEVIYFKTAGSATVLLEDGTENILTSGVYTEPAEGEDTEAEEVEEDASGAALRAKCDLTITGAGSLNVYGYINNGIASTGDLAVSGGSVTVTAVNDALKARGELLVSDGVLALSADGDGIQSDGAMTITGGDISVTTGSGAAEADMKVSDSLMMGNMGGGGGGRDRRGSDEAAEDADVADDSETQADTASAEPEENRERTDAQETGETESKNRSGSDEMRFPWDADDENAVSRKGLKAGGDITIAGGTLTLDTEDDAIHTDTNVIITGGTLLIASGDDGVHADDALTIYGGNTTVTYCYEGLEATNITISGGYTDVTATDDGLNVNGGDFGMMMWASGEASDETEEDTETETPTLLITDGTLIVDSGGDGLDSNGDIHIEGGVIFVSGPSSNWDAAIDYGDGRYEYVISGGYVMAGGYSGMAETPDSSEDSQCSIYYVSDDYCADGDTVRLLDADGNVLLEYAFVHGFNCVILSSPDIAEDGVYTLEMGDQSYTIEMAGAIYSNRSRGGMGGFPGSREMSASGEADESDAA